MTRFRIVTPDETPPDTAHHDAMRAALEQAIADGALAIMLTYETATGFGHACFPALSCVRAGFVTEIVKSEMAEMNE